MYTTVDLVDVLCTDDALSVPVPCRPCPPFLYASLFPFSSLLSCHFALSCNKNPHVSIHIHTLALQIFPRLLNLRHQFLVGLRDVVEGEDSVAEFPQEIGAEGDEGPEGEVWYYFELEFLGKWEETHEEHCVEGSDQEA